MPCRGFSARPRELRSRSEESPAKKRARERRAGERERREARGESGQASEEGKKATSDEKSGRLPPTSSVFFLLESTSSSFSHTYISLSILFSSRSVVCLSSSRNLSALHRSFLRTNTLNVPSSREREREREGREKQEERASESTSFAASLHFSLSPHFALSEVGSPGGLSRSATDPFLARGLQNCSYRG